MQASKVLLTGGRSTVLLLNSDLGEGFIEVDRQIMPYIDQANIACGGHAGDTASMHRSILLAQAHDVTLGAHPSYPDKNHFGRVSMNIASSDLKRTLMNQIENFTRSCRALNTDFDYIKAHGALYNDSNIHQERFITLLECAQHFGKKLMVQALPEETKRTELANRYGVPLIYEGFADRRYNNDGTLVSRKHANAVLNNAQCVIKQAKEFAQFSRVETGNGQFLALTIDSLCVHGDNHNALQAVKAIRHALN